MDVEEIHIFIVIGGGKDNVHGSLATDLIVVVGAVLVGKDGTVVRGLQVTVGELVGGVGWVGGYNVLDRSCVEWREFFFVDL